MLDKVLILGGGGREHALAWKLNQSPKIGSIYVMPGNAGTHKAGKIINVDVSLANHQQIIDWCLEHEISTVVVGPELPLAEGISDQLHDKGVPCFGPGCDASQIEASKLFAKEFMLRWNIPTARYKCFDNPVDAECFIKQAPFKALVVKTSGLAAGKGVIVASNEEEACQAVQHISQTYNNSENDNKIIIEELLEGEEISCLAFTDGVTVCMMPPAQDYKRLYEGDKGPNTGGMGAYCPYDKVADNDLEFIKTEILQRAVDGLRQENKILKGVLYAGIMLTSDGPKVLEFNCRFGDPETQVLLPLMESDLYDVILACINQKLNVVRPTFCRQKYAVAVVTAAKGYPTSYRKNVEIKGIDKVQKQLGQIVFHAGTKYDEKSQQILSNGGRVLAVVAIETTLSEAARRAMMGTDTIQYEDKFFRSDIAIKPVNSELTYKDAGVDIEAGEAVVNEIKQLTEKIPRSGFAAPIGLFGAMYDLRQKGYLDPLIISSTDGVGTKLKIAQTCRKHSTIGIDLVAMCVNDVLCHGAEPLFFLDYFACGKLNVSMTSDVIKGVTGGCQQAGCTLIGGETAEMPGMYRDEEYDVAGFAVGAVERKQYLPRVADISPGDHVIGLLSSGLHSNGFSLIRLLVDKTDLRYSNKCPFDLEKTLGEALLTPTRIYVKPVIQLLKTTKVKAMAHITGGGLPGNIARVLPDNLGVELDATCWPVPDVFKWIASQHCISESEMLKTFNCGIGFVLIAAKEEDPGVICRRLTTSGCESWSIGSVVKQKPGEHKVVVKNLNRALQTNVCTPNVCTPAGVEHVSDLSLMKKKKKRVAILISGSGSNMKALIDWTQDPNNNASSEIVLIISNVANVQGLTLAGQANIPTKVISHKDYKTREQFASAIHSCLVSYQVDIVCLAGFMRILPGDFVQKWNGRILNVHPSLLPSFKGANAHKQVLEHRVRITGCTIHFVAEEVDAGAILLQQPVPVYPDDTIQTLSDRVKLAEHQAFPQALELVSSGKVTLDDDGHIVWN